jgi:hypothetical protein
VLVVVKENALEVSASGKENVLVVVRENVLEVSASGKENALEVSAKK